MTVYAIGLIGGRVMEVEPDIRKIYREGVDLYDILWVVRSGPLWKWPIGISIHKCLWDTNYFDTVSRTYGGAHRMTLYEAVEEAIWADPDTWDTGWGE